MIVFDELVGNESPVTTPVTAISTPPAQQAFPLPVLD